MSLMIFTIFVGGKYLAKNAFASRSYVGIDAGGCELSHTLALSLRVNGNSLKKMSSLDTPLYLKVS